MDTAMVRAALPSLERQLEKAREAKKNMEGDDLQGGGYAYPEDAFAWFLGDAYESIMLVLEAAGLTEAGRTWQRNGSSSRIKEAGLVN